MNGLDSDSRILTISSSPSTSSNLVRKIHSSVPEFSGNKIPWTISNKYYSADVHFELCTTNAVDSARLHGVPAILYVWSHGQTWRKDVLNLSQLIRDRHDPEVAIAIRTSPLSTEESAPETSNESSVEDDDQAEIDDYLSSLGFEFVDDYEISESRSEEHIPGLPRVVDALSTIMWPGMQTRAKDTSIDMTPTGNTNEDRDYMRSKAYTDSDKFEREIKELVHWLEDEQGVAHTDPWKIGSATQNISTSPTDISSNSDAGFDDDFSVFITAPPADSGDSIGADESFNSAFSASDTLGLSAYATLGSVSDVNSIRGEVDDEETFHFEEAEFPDLSEEEIKETSAQIFGWPTSTYPGPSSGTPFSSEDPVLNKDPLLDPQPPSRTPDPEADLSAFDFTQILSTLEGMKAQIADISDESEKRRMAARVALGLVYGAGRDDPPTP